jgi:hypothetical protein
MSAKDHLEILAIGSTIMLVPHARGVAYTGLLGGSMFDSLADRIREDEHKEVNNTERYLRWAAVIILSLVLFGGLYMGVRLLE